ncbi:hypothetical protein [Burkholderia sp. PAMC 26561]|uniref:hypothetical protein n=1 Tax=Burkholderia sp. PAMC 26561 TaxID=1795043 RepID=UPI000AB17738|nr:hypothetical protein [Burkholderia sp. PAMC 26561]
MSDAPKIGHKEEEDQPRVNVEAAIERNWPPCLQYGDASEGAFQGLILSDRQKT